jgi:hypothetical protein
MRAAALNGPLGRRVAIGEPVEDRDGGHLRRPLREMAVVRDINLVMARVDPNAVRIGDPGVGASDPALAGAQLGEIGAATIDDDH